MYPRSFRGNKKKRYQPEQEQIQSGPVLLQASLLFEHEATARGHSPRTQPRPNQIAKGEQETSNTREIVLQEIQSAGVFKSLSVPVHFLLTYT
jgi:hypothetical protein